MIHSTAWKCLADTMQGERTELEDAGMGNDGRAVGNALGLV